MVSGNFKADLVGLEISEMAKYIAEALAAAVLEDMASHFIPSRRPWALDGSTWSMVRLGQ